MAGMFRPVRANVAEFLKPPAAVIATFVVSGGASPLVPLTSTSASVVFRRLSALGGPAAPGFPYSGP